MIYVVGSKGTPDSTVPRHKGQQEADKDAEDPPMGRPLPSLHPANRSQELRTLDKTIMLGLELNRFRSLNMI